ncbi:MAG: GYD domain-containing protein [Halobacteriota archaeon]
MVYILLVKWTQAGIVKAKDIPQRLERSRNVIKSVGGELKEIYFTFGRYDMIVTVEAPSDEAIGKATLAIAGAGAVTIETLKAFSEAEMSNILAGLP